MSKPLLYLVNGNSNSMLTARLAALASARVGVEMKIESATVVESPFQILTRSDVARSAVHILDHIEARFSEADRQKPSAIILACFGEPGLGAVRDTVDVPVFGLLESSARAASQLGAFSILTPGDPWPPQLQDLLRVYQLSGHCREIAVYSDAALSSDMNHARAAIEHDCNRLAARHDVTSVILGGALAAGLASNIEPPSGVAVIDGFLATVDACLRELSLTPAEV